MIYVDNTNEYSQRIYIPKDEADATSGVTGHTITLQNKDYIITENGTTRIHADAGYDGISGGTIGVYVSAATGVTFEHLNVTEDGLYVPTGDTVYTGVTVQVHDAAYQEGYDAGYQAGYNSGYTDGRLSGYNEGYASGHSDGYASGITDGFAQGYSSGHTDGYQEGRNDGYSEGYSSGATDGYAEGYQVGYAEGYSDGHSAGYDEGIAVGALQQKALLTAETFTENGTYRRENGWSAVTVQVDDSGYENGYQDGINYQKSLLGSIEVTANGETYTSENGYSAVTTNLMLPMVMPRITTNGQHNIYASDLGYQGFSGVEITVDVPTTGSTPTLTALTATTNGAYFPPEGIDGFSRVDVMVQLDTAATYSSGFTDGYASGHTDGYTAGTDAQKALLSSTSLTVNGLFTSENGWSAVTVNVPTAATYNSGYTSGYTDGSNYQKSLLGSTAFTSNGTFTKSNGWSAVTVNVPTNYTMQNYGVTVHSNYMPGLLGTFTAHATASTNSVQDGVDLIDFTLSSEDGRLVTKYKPGYMMSIGFEAPSGYTVPSQVSGFTWWNRGWKIDVTCNVANLSKLSQFTATTRNGASANYNTKYAGDTEKVTMFLEKETDGSWSTLPSPRNAQSITYTNNKWIFEYSSGDTVAIKSFGNHRVFWEDTDLQTLEFPVSVKSLGNQNYAMCFSCTSLTSVVAPGCIRVGTEGFGLCTALTSVTLSENLYRLDLGAFSDCSKLEYVNTSKVEILGSDCFSRTKLRSIDLSSVHVFAPVTLPPTQEKEGWLARATCYFCEYLTGVTIGAGITDLAGDSFYHCQNLSSITCLATTAPRLRNTSGYDTWQINYPFTDISSTGVLRVPSGSDYSSWLAHLGSGWTVQYI